MVLSLTPYNHPFFQNEVPKCTSRDQLHDACCHLVNIIEDVTMMLTDTVYPI